MKKTILFCFIIIAACVLAICFKYKLDSRNNTVQEGNDPSSGVLTCSDNLACGFEFKYIKSVNSKFKNQNYMISPLSIATALKMLEYGAKGETYNQINVALSDYNFVDSFNIKDRVGIANAAFIKNDYKNMILKDYYNNLNKLDAEIIYDEFTSPDVINNWVNKKTFGMIPKILDSISSDFVLGVANAIAIDVDWNSQFECINTKSGEFTKLDGSKEDVVMMNESSDNGDVSFIKNDKAKGIIKDYASYDRITGERLYHDSDKTNAVSLEYIAIIPNDYDSYVDNLDSEEINKLIKTKKASSSNYHINLSLPRYSYEFEFDNKYSFKDSLKCIGIEDMFDEQKANFDNIIGPEFRLYVSTAIHKTKIELNEKGTKAAAVTYFGLDKAMAESSQPEIETIKFNKPFIYIIKEKDKDNIWFFGTVVSPEKWTKDTVTCSKYE